MIPKECKRFAEVDFPIAEVSKHSAREKSIRHGHQLTLHLTKEEGFSVKQAITQWQESSQERR